MTGDGAVFRSPAGCQVDDILLDDHQVKIALEEPIANQTVITEPDRRVGVSVFKASASCRREMERRLARLAATK